MSNRIGGIAFVKVDGAMYKLKGDWTYNLGYPTRSTVTGGDGRPHGHKEEAGEPMMEGEIPEELIMAVVKGAGAPVVVETPADDDGQKQDIAWLRKRL